MSELEAPQGRKSDLRYVQIADDVEQRIASGELKPGARLISERDLAEFYDVSYGTIRRVMKELRERGLISTVHGRGTFVIPQPKEGSTGPASAVQRLDRPAKRGDTEDRR